MANPELPDSIAGNVADWTRSNADFTDAQAEAAWAPQALTWGVFNVPEDAIGSVPRCGLTCPCHRAQNEGGPSTVNPG